MPTADEEEFKAEPPNLYGTAKDRLIRVPDTRIRTQDIEILTFLALKYKAERRLQCQANTNHAVKHQD